MNTIRKTLSFGKIDYNKTGRRVNEVEIELSLTKNDEGKPCFTACGNIWNSKHTDILIGGQCIDEIAKLVHNKTVKRIKEIWKRYHLNDMHAGCEHQREFENEPYENHRGYHCDICNYTYGTAWRYEEIPQDVLKEIQDLMK